MSLAPAKSPTRRAIADRMVEAGKENPDFVVFDSDIGYSTYSYLFGDAYPRTLLQHGHRRAGHDGRGGGHGGGRPHRLCLRLRRLPDHAGPGSREVLRLLPSPQREDTFQPFWGYGGHRRRDPPGDGGPGLHGDPAEHDRSWPPATAPAPGPPSTWPWLRRAPCSCASCVTRSRRSTPPNTDFPRRRQPYPAPRKGPHHRLHRGHGHPGARGRRSPGRRGRICRGPGSLLREALGRGCAGGVPGTDRRPARRGEPPEAQRPGLRAGGLVHARRDPGALRPARARRTPLRRAEPTTRR